MEILLVEDEDTIRDVLKSYFVKKGWGVLVSANGKDALEKIRNFRVDLVLLDLMIPGLSGEKVCLNIRSKSNVPIIMVTSKSSEEDMINGLNLGADDYITKPFRIKEVIARITALQRRVQMHSTDKRKVKHFDNNRFVINFETKEVFIDGRVVLLTFTEFKILDVMAKHPGKVFNRHDLSYEVQGYRYIGDGRTTDAHIKNIRKKIEEDPKNPKYIVTKIGAGYKFNCFPDEAIR